MSFVGGPPKSGQCSARAVRVCERVRVCVSVSGFHFWFGCVQIIYLFVFTPLLLFFAVLTLTQGWRKDDVRAYFGVRKRKGDVRAYVGVRKHRGDVRAYDDIRRRKADVSAYADVRTM